MISTDIILLFLSNNSKVKHNNKYNQYPLKEDIESDSNVLSDEVELRVFSNQNRRENKISKGKQSNSNISAKVKTNPILASK